MDAKNTVLKNVAGKIYNVILNVLKRIQKAIQERKNNDRSVEVRFVIDKLFTQMEINRSACLEAQFYAHVKWINQDTNVSKNERLLMEPAHRFLSKQSN